MLPEHLLLARFQKKPDSELMLPDRVSLKEYVMQKQEIIFMIFQQRFRNMRRALVMELCVSLLAMALAHICMKIRKFQTLRQLEEESACALA